MPTSPFLPIVRLLVALLGLVLGASGCKMSHAPSEQDSLEQARSFMVQHDYRSAIVDLKSAIQAKPDNPESRFLLGQAYVAVLLGSDAETQFRRAMALGMSTAPVVEGLTKALLLQNKTAEALQVLDGGAGFSDEEAADMSALRGDALLAQGDKEGARAAVDEAIRLRPGSMTALLAKANLDLAEGRYDEARARSGKGAEGRAVFRLGLEPARRSGAGAGASEGGGAGVYQGGGAWPRLRQLT